MQTTHTTRTTSILPHTHGVFHEDPMLQHLRAMIRQPNADLLTEAASEAALIALRPETDPRLAVLLLLDAAEAYRLLAQPQRSSDLLHSAYAALPAASTDLLGMIRRGQAKLLLDAQQLDEALTTARQADSFEFVRVAGAAPLLEGNDDMVTPDTWLLIAECLLTIGDYEEVERVLRHATTAIDRDQQRWLANFDFPELASFDPAYTYFQEQIDNQNSLAQLLQTAFTLRPENHAVSTSSLQTLRQPMLSAESPNAAIISRINVLLGEWTPQRPLPPLGLTLAEATRWADFAAPDRAQRFRLAVTTKQESVDLTPAVSEPTAAPATSTDDSTEVLQTLVEKLSLVFDRAFSINQRNHGTESETPAGNTPTGLTVMPAVGFVIGGALSDFNLFEQIEQASRSRLTGYFHVTWNPSPFEEMIATGNLDTTAALGQGWLFLREGLLIDATLGEPTWPITSTEDLSADTLQTRQAAKLQQATSYIRTLLQVAVASMKTEECVGQAYAYKAADVAERERVFDIRDNTKYLLEMITAIEGGNCSADSEDADIEGSWEEVSGPRANVDPGVTHGSAGAPNTVAGVSTAFLPILGARTRTELLEAIRMALEEFRGDKVFVQLIGGGRVLGETTSQPWSQPDKLASQDNSFYLSLAEGLTLTVGVTNPLKEDLLRTVLEVSGQRFRLLDRSSVPSPSNPGSLPAGMVIASKAMRTLYDRLVTFAPYDGLEGKQMNHILITGETGVGKEVVAREIHRLSHRANATWRGENLAAMPKELVRSAIFGHVKGSFTGASADQLGLLQQTEGGTLLLDEFGELDLHTQALLLRMMEEATYSPVGSKEQRTLKTRLIFATNRPIDDERVFRKDIKFRCSIVRIPPLRERLEDIRPLAIHFAATHKAEIDEAALTWAEAQPWPGNVRELKSLIDEVAPKATRNGSPITLDALAAVSSHTSPSMEVLNPTGDLVLLPGETLETAVERLKLVIVKHYLPTAGSGHGSKSRLAKLLGIPRTTLLGILPKIQS